MNSCKFALVLLAFIATSLLPYSHASLTWNNKGQTSETSRYSYPGARFGAVSWTGSDGALYMFSGVGTEGSKSEGYLDQFYKYNFATSKWILVSGGTTLNQAGKFSSIGSKGYPGGRQGAAKWVDKDGNLWMFGGKGIGNKQGVEGHLNDLWKYTPSQNTWFFMAGNSEVNPAASDAAPSARSGAACWVDESGNLVLFGGRDGSSSDDLDDLWSFNPSTRTWEKLTKSVTPKARANAVSWVDSEGAGWVYGGQSRGTVLSDLWQYKDAAWTMISTAIHPGKIHSASAFSIANDLFLFGGQILSNGKQAATNDLWKFDAAAGSWQIVFSSNSKTGSLVAPGARFGTMIGNDKSGNVVVFGGNGYDTPFAASHILGDTWIANIAVTPRLRSSFAVRASNDTGLTTTTGSASNATTSTTGSLTTGATTSTAAATTSTAAATTSTAAATTSTAAATTSTGKSGATSTTAAAATTTAAAATTTAATVTTTGTPAPTSTPTPAPTTTVTATVTLNLNMQGDPDAVNTADLGSSVASSLGVDPSTVNVTIVVDSKRAVNKNFHVVITVFFPNSSAIEAATGGAGGGSGVPNITASVEALKGVVTAAANSTAVTSVIAASGATVTSVTATTTQATVPVPTTAPVTTATAATSTTTNKNSPGNMVLPSFFIAAIAILGSALVL